MFLKFTYVLAIKLPNSPVTLDAIGRLAGNKHMSFDRKRKNGRNVDFRNLNRSSVASLVLTRMRDLHMWILQK